MSLNRRDIATKVYELNVCIGKAWTASDRVAIIWKSNLSNKRKILPSCNSVSTIVWLHYLDFKKIP